MKQRQSKLKQKNFKIGLFILLVCISMVFPVKGFSQEKTLTGKVVDTEGVALIGASIIIKGTTTGTETDFDGKFSIKVNTGAVLIFSYLGYKTKEVVVGDQTVLNITLEDDASKLDEIVVVGYGTQKKSDLTGAVGQVKSEELVKVATVNPADALQGRVAGVTVVKSSGSPGSGVDIKIRGIGTNGVNSPLFIVDGVQTTSYYLDPNNIESIEVLKDVSSAAIYGTRAANGVIIITTKKGKKGEPVVDFDSYVSFNKARKLYNLLDGPGYISVHRQMYENAGGALPNYITNPVSTNTDWMNAIFRDAIQTNQSLRISGATDLVNYSLSGNTIDEEGIILGSDFKKKNVALNLGIKKNKFTFQGNLTYAETRREGYRFSLRSTYHLTPLVPIYDPTKESGYGYADDASLPDQPNPIAINDNVEGNTKLQYTLLNASLGYEIIEGMQAKLNMSQVVENNKSFGFTRRFRPNRTQDNDTYIFGQVREFNSQFKRQMTEALLTYNKTVGDHNFDVLLGYSRIFEPYRQADAVADGYKLDAAGNQVLAELIDPDFKTINAFGNDGTTSASGYNNEYALVSQFGRINYAFKDKYLFQASVRRDGSSKFGSNNKYGVFPSFALGWKITEEDFMKDHDFVNFLKLRFSWGQAGNDSSLGRYDFSPLIEEGKNHFDGGYVFGGVPTRGAISRDLVNNDLKWEVNTSTNIGVDFGFLNNHLTGSANYYSSLTSDLLFRRSLPSSVGLNDPFVNIGEFKNSGMELELNYRNSIKDFNFNIGATFTTVKNEVTKLANDGQEVAGDGLKFGSDHYVNSTRVGYEAGAFFLYQASGIFQSQAEIDAHDPTGTLQPGAAPGDIRFIDQNGDGLLNDDDLIYAGTGIPKFEYSLNLSADYKGFDATIFLQGVGGNKIYDGNAFEMQGMEAARNFTTNTLNAWTPNNTNTDIPRAVLGDPNQNNRPSTRFLSSGAYLRLKTIQLGYSLPSSITEKLKISKFRLYVTGQNLFTITDYQGLDPEVAGRNVLNSGTDRTLYPKFKSFILGAQIKL